MFLKASLTFQGINCVTVDTENMALSGQHTLAQVNRKIQALESSSQ
tara:strand:+ start:66223 stop:66360 length:138 start_codon:yes stop_codon:yes gene_type:complete